MKTLTLHRNRLAALPFIAFFSFKLVTLLQADQIRWLSVVGLVGVVGSIGYGVVRGEAKGVL